MDDVETPECSKLAREVTRYAWGELPEDSRPAIEKHLSQCPSCSELTSFVGKMTAAARENQGRWSPPADPHPEPSLIVDLEAEELDEETAERVSVHLLRCRPCREAYLRLRSLSMDHFEET